MTDGRKVAITTLATGVPGLDEVLGGGLPEYSFNLIAGEPGAGKTILSHQIMFANATPERPALHLTVLGEPPVKMLRYQQQFAFFDLDRVGSAVRFVDLGQEALQQDPGAVLEAIRREVEQSSPGLVVVDSFRSVIRVAAAVERGQMELAEFLQRLALHLTTWQATTFLVGEYAERELRDSPVCTVADGILWLSQSVDRNSSVRKLRVLKVRGRAILPGLHTVRITDDGLQVFPRIIKREAEAARPRPARRLSTGVAGLDELLGGGIPAGDSVLVAGPAGSGKSMLGNHFVAEGLRRGEPGVIAVFEEHPGEYLARAKSLGIELEAPERAGRLEALYLRPLDLSVDETLLAIQDAVRRLGARRLVIDSLSGFELALAPTFREDFRESLYRMVRALTGAGVTVLLTVEIAQSQTELHFSPQLISFLADDVILQRYVEMDGQLRRVLAVIKMRGSRHSPDLRAYEITGRGLAVGEALRDYRGLITGVAERRERPRADGPAGPGPAADGGV